MTGPYRDDSGVAHLTARLDEVDKRISRLQKREPFTLPGIDIVFGWLGLLVVTSIAVVLITALGMLIFKQSPVTACYPRDGKDGIILMGYRPWSVDIYLGTAKDTNELGALSARLGCKGVIGKL